MAEKQTNKERLKDITDSIETGIKELFESDKYRQYLATMSRFHRYSVNNTMLIYMQRPDASHVAGFNKWRDQFGSSVKKGEKGIKIIAPTPFKKKIEQQKLDPDTKLPLRDENGDIITEEKTVQIPMYKPVVVFDVQQTAGKPLPELAANLTGNVQNYEVFMEALRRSAPEARPNVLSFHEILLDNARHNVTVSGTPVELTYKEYSLLRLLLENTNLVVTRETILQVVWGTDISVESRTVDMHIRTLRKKLGDAGKYICTVRKVGYKLTDEEEAGEE